MERPLFGRSDIKRLSSPGLWKRRRARRLKRWRRTGARVVGGLVFADQADELPVADPQAAFVLRIDARHRCLEAQLAHDLRKKRVKRDAPVSPLRPRLLSFPLAPLALTHWPINYHFSAANSNLQKADNDRPEMDEVRRRSSRFAVWAVCDGQRSPEMDGGGQTRTKIAKVRQKTVSVGREFWMARCVMWAHIGGADAPITPFLTRFARRKRRPLE